MELQTLHAREILDSRGNPTLEVEVILEDGAIADIGTHAELVSRPGIVE